MSSTHRKTETGRQALQTRQPPLSRPLRNLLLLIDGRRDDEELLGMLGPTGIEARSFAQLAALGLIERSDPTARGRQTSPAAPPAAPAAPAPPPEQQPAPEQAPAQPLPELQEVLDMLEDIGPPEGSSQLPETVAPETIAPETIAPEIISLSRPPLPDAPSSGFGQRSDRSQQPATPAVADATAASPEAQGAAAPPERKRSMFARLGQGMRDMLQGQQESPREVSAGLAEVIKCAAVADAEFFSWIEAHLEALRARDSAAVAHVVQRYPQLRAEIEAADRRLKRSPSPLSFGTRLGGALESLVGYGQYLHGEAVGLGMFLSAALGEDLAVQSPSSAERLRRVLERAGLPTRMPRGVAGRWLELLPVDRPGPQGMLELVLLEEVARPLTRRVAPSAVLEALDHLGALSS